VIQLPSLKIVVVVTTVVVVVGGIVVAGGAVVVVVAGAEVVGGVVVVAGAEVVGGVVVIGGAVVGADVVLAGEVVVGEVVVGEVVVGGKVVVVDATSRWSGSVASSTRAMVVDGARVVVVMAGASRTMRGRASEGLARGADVVGAAVVDWDASV
jgi:hypothetical protein